MIFELGVYRTRDGHLARINGRSHGYLLHGYVMEDSPQHKWICGGMWQIRPYPRMDYEADFAEFERWGQAPRPELDLVERVDEIRPEAERLAGKERSNG